ncbi:MAG: SDR family oxidoreductase [Pseudomonadota bacterium]
MSLQKVYGLDGQRALVTGGGTGIGRAIASCLIQSGAEVVIAGRRADVLRATAADLGTRCSHVVLDITDAVALASTESEIGPVDILVNNAGNTLKKPFEDQTIAEFDQVFDVHVRGGLELSRLVMRRMMAEGRSGNIQFLSSMTAFIGQPLVSGYTISKTAINGVVRGLAAEFASRNIRVNGVAPGWIDTDIFRKATRGDPERKAKIMGRIPMRQLGAPEDVGWCCAFLASKAAKYINGQVVLVDGGGATGF